MRRNTLLITRAAVIAVLYVILTFLCSAVGLASGQLQLRLSDALAVLCAFTPAGVYGVTVGCLLANLLTGCMPTDVVLGTLATLLGALGTRALRRRGKYLAPVPTVLSNTLIIPLLLYFVYGVRPLWLGFVTVFTGEAVSCFALGLPLYSLIDRNRRALGLEE